MMKTFLDWMQDHCGLKSRGETLWFLLLCALGWGYFLHQYLYGTGLAEALPAYAGF